VRVPAEESAGEASALPEPGAAGYQPGGAGMPPEVGAGGAGAMAAGNVRRGGGLLGTGVRMGLGLATVGVAGYAFLALVGHVFRPELAAALASTYLMINIIGPGVFTALEQETNRSVSARIARGRALGPVLRRTAMLAAALFAAAAVVLVALGPVLVPRVLAGRVGLLVALVVAAGSAALLYWVRGTLAGEQRFGGYSVTLFLEGGARLLPCVALAVAGWAVADAYGLAFAAGAGIAALVVFPGLGIGRARDGESLGPGEGAAIARGLAWLVSATLLTQVLANLAPVVVTGRLTGDKATAVAFATAFVMSRIPLFLFSPVQAVLLPALTREAEAGRLPEVRRRVRLVVAAVCAVGLPGAVLAALLGPWAIRVFFGAPAAVSPAVFGLLGLSTVLAMLTQVLQPALVALGRHRAVTTAWVAGTVVFLLILVLPVAPVTAALVAQLAGPGVVLLMGGAVLLRALNSEPATR
jgi:O-antigen/teichoic acid export membrane protein